MFWTKPRSTPFYLFLCQHSPSPLLWKGLEVSLNNTRKITLMLRLWAHGWRNKDTCTNTHARAHPHPHRHRIQISSLLFPILSLRFFFFLPSSQFAYEVVSVQNTGERRLNERMGEKPNLMQIITSHNVEPQKKREGGLQFTQTETWGKYDQ